ncbi:MAG: 50S ribosomal protein L15 [Dehalococcoidales bacterium]|nr:50S ribosomal protein L15 [Dehalococcoidales bacterium]MDD3994225.1 50S ribosomal protein L15 [Dehalococcoidales bacterium]NLT28281.1 50S ribosomal protein L15 [Dehalococcoidales bacterium]
MRQELLSPATGSKKDRKRVGRGNGSGHGTYSGRGCKGQKSRAGNNKVRPGFEGGQLPLIKRLPRKRGFTNIFKTEYEVVNLSSLNGFEAGSEITADKLVEAGIIKNTKKPLKILSRGDLNQSLNVKADKFSAAAKAKIEAAGGTVTEVANG